jgi:hypothetical protein
MIRSSSFRSAVFLGALAGSWSSHAFAGDKTTVELQSKTPRPWEIQLPEERWVDVTGGIPVPHKNGARFVTLIEGDMLRADLDGDGTPDARVEGDTGSIDLAGTSPEGHAIRYSVRLARFNNGPWKFTCGSVLEGEIAGTRVQFIDQNLNGSFNDVGEDAIVVGRDPAASYFSRVVSIDGHLYSIDVARDGSSFTYEDYTGPSGVLDMTSSFTCKAKLRAAVVKSTDGKYSFNLARGKSGTTVPAGDYVLASGQIVLGESKATIRGGRSAPIRVGADSTAKVTWGGPVTGEFAYERKGGEVTFTPWDIWYYGKLGEEYSQFLPLGKSPEFTVKDTKSGEQLAQAKFPGNC